MRFSPSALILLVMLGCDSQKAITESAIREKDKGLRHLVRREYDAAIYDFTEAIRLDPNYAKAFVARGEAYRWIGGEENYDKAIYDFTEAIRLDPNDITGYFLRGMVYRDLGNCDKAIADFTQAIRIDPEHANAYYMRGKTYRAQKDDTKADADFARAKELGHVEQ